jgi:hypothetical protein
LSLRDTLALKGILSKDCPGFINNKERSLVDRENMKALECNVLTIEVGRK